MNHESWKVFAACFLGGAIGTLIAIKINPPFWWVGLMVGVTIAFFSYEFKTVMSTFQQLLTTSTTIATNKLLLEALLLNLAALIAVSLTIFIPAVLSYLVLWATIGETPAVITETTRTLFGPCMSVIVLSILAEMLFFLQVIGSSTFKLLKCPQVYLFERIKENNRKSLRLILLWNPFSFYIYWPLKIFWWSLIHVPEFVVSVLRFSVQFIRLIYSDGTVSCCLGTIIGIIIGYSYQDAGIAAILIGGLSGGIIGIFNYKILAKYILALLPKRI